MRLPKVGEELPEDVLWYQLKAIHQETGLIMPERNVKVFPDSGYEWDFLWRAPIKLLVEIQGGVWMEKGGHNTGKGIERDVKKNNLAVMRGYDCLYYTTKMVKDGIAFNEIEKYLRERS